MTSTGYILPFFLLFLFISNGCSLFAPSISINYQSVESFPDSSSLVRVWTEMGSREIEFGTTRVVPAVFRVLNDQGDTTRLRLWSPVTGNIDRKRLVVLIPPYGAPDLAMVPVAAELTRRGLSTAIVSPRGTGLNVRLTESFGIRKLEDIANALQAYRQVNSLDSLRVGVFGSSLGGVIGLNLLKIEPQINVVVVEGLMLDLDAAAKEVLESSSYDNLDRLLEQRSESMADYSPGDVIPLLRPVPLLAIWGSDDKLVSQVDRARLRQLLLASMPESETIEIPGGAHTMRYGFPLSAAEANALNARIADFIERHLR